MLLGTEYDLNKCFLLTFIKTVNCGYVFTDPIGKFTCCVFDESLGAILPFTFAVIANDMAVVRTNADVPVAEVGI